MKASMLGLVVSTVAFGGTSLYLWQQLKDERELSQQAFATTRQLNTRLAEFEKARSEFASRRKANSGGAFMGGSFGQAGAPMPPPAPGADRAAARENGARWNMAPMPPSPAFQKMARSQTRGANKRLYADIGSKLGLSKDDANKLIDLITEQQMEGFGAMHSDLDPAEARLQWDEKKRRDQAAIVDLVGADKAVALQEYQESLPARQEVEMLARQLEGNDVTLSEDQRKRLVTVYAEERKRVPFPEYVDGQDGAEYDKQVNAWQEDYNKRVSAEANNILNTEQLAAYTEIQQWQQEMRENFANNPGNGMRRIRVNGGGPGNAMFMTTAPAFISATAVNVESQTPDAKSAKPK